MAASAPPPYALRLKAYAELEAYVRAFAAGQLHLLLLFGPPAPPSEESSLSAASGSRCGDRAVFRFPRRLRTRLSRAIAPAVQAIREWVDFATGKGRGCTLATDTGTPSRGLDACLATDIRPSPVYLCRNRFLNLQSGTFTAQTAPALPRRRPPCGVPCISVPTIASVHVHLPRLPEPRQEPCHRGRAHASSQRFHWPRQ